MNIFTRLSALLIAIGLSLTACSTHKQAHHAAKPIAQKHAVAERPGDVEPLNQLQPNFLYLAAQDALNNGQHALAIKLLTALAQQDHNAIQPHIQLLELLIESAQYKQAKQHLTALLQHKTQSDSTERDSTQKDSTQTISARLSTTQYEYLELASIRLLAAQQQTATALQELDVFLKKHPAHVNARNIQAKILASEQRYDEALSALNEAIKINDLPDFRLLQAQLLIKANKPTAAEKSLHRMQQIDPDNDTPILMLSSLALKHNRIAEAEKLLRSFLHQHPSAIRVTQTLGQLLMNTKRPVEAILIYRNAATLSSDNPNILQPLAMLYFQRQNYSDAESTFRQLVAIQPNDTNHFYLAASLEALHRTKEAQEIYQRLDPASPLAADAQLRLAAMEIMNDQLSAAESRLKSILKHNPKHLDALLMLSTIRLNQGKFQQLLDETDSVIMSPKLPSQLLFNRAVASESLKQYDQVETMLNRVIRAVPQHTEALNFLAYTYAEQGIKLPKAEALLHRALLLEPNNGYYLDSLAWVYYKSGDFSKAINTQKQALKNTSDDATMFEHYGDMLWQHKDEKAARQAWQKSIDLKAKNIPMLKDKISNGIIPLP